jgi:hypothetical protein
LDDRGGHIAQGTRTVQTEYRFHPPAGPPFPAELIVISLRESGRRSTDELLKQVERAIEEALEANNIVLDSSKSISGERKLESGLATTWLVREGKIGSQPAPDSLFGRESTIRIIGEVAHDGRSSTSVVLIGLAQIGRVDRGPLNTQLGETRDARTWIELVGDPTGTVAGATSQKGFIYNLRTHG